MSKYQRNDLYLLFSLSLKDLPIFQFLVPVTELCIVQVSNSESHDTVTSVNPSL